MKTIRIFSKLIEKPNGEVFWKEVLLKPAEANRNEIEKKGMIKIQIFNINLPTRKPLLNF